MLHILPLIFVTYAACTDRPTDMLGTQVCSAKRWSDHRAPCMSQLLLFVLEGGYEAVDSLLLGLQGFLHLPRARPTAVAPFMHDSRRTVGVPATDAEDIALHVDT